MPRLATGALVSRTSYTTDPAGTWDVWIGPGPEPGTGRVLGAKRWSNHLALWGEPASDVGFLAWLYETPWLREQAQRDLRGKRLGTSSAAHGLILSRVADGVAHADVAAELADLLCETRPLWPGGEA